MEPCSERVSRDHVSVVLPDLDLNREGSGTVAAATDIDIIDIKVDKGGQPENGTTCDAARLARLVSNITED